MSDDYVTLDEVPRSQGIAPSTSSTEKKIKRLILIVAALISLELLWLMILRPCLPLGRIEISEIEGLQKEAVIAWAGITEKTSYFSANTTALKQKLETLPQVETALVQTVFPDGLRIMLTPRKAVAMSLATVAGSIVPIYYDRQGVIFKIGKKNDEQHTAYPWTQGGVPLVSGLSFYEPALGTRLPAQYRSFLSGLNTIREMSPVLLQAISEIQISAKPFDTFDLVLFPAHIPIRVRTSSDINEEMLRYVLLILDVLHSEKMKIEEIDFRVGMAAYTFKGARSGK
ncbi:cell division protein FtsQ/DivIB [Breznakiellaceae bacterium SP9]